MGMPDDQPRVIRKKIAIRAERLRKEARRQERIAGRAGRDNRILATQQAEASQQFDSIGSHITVRPRSPIYSPTPSTSAASSDDDDKPLTAVQASQPTEGRSQSEPPPPPPPASTAPPAIEGGRAIRKRAGTGFYSALLSGNSQEIKRARQA